MKKLMYLGLVATALSLYSCGGDNKNSSNPNDKAEEFSNPTGTLTDSNANDVGQASLDANNASGADNPFNFTELSKTSDNSVGNKYIPSKYALEEGDVTACIDTTDSGESTVDWECVFDLEGGDECSGSGTTVSSATTGDDGFYTVDYNDFSIDCGDDFTFSCNGTVSISTETTGLFCTDLSCDINDDDHTFEGCVNAEGDILIDVDGESFVMTSIVTDGTCSTMTFSITDSTGTSTLTCDVTTAEDGCSTVDGVQTVGSCTIS